MLTPDGQYKQEKEIDPIAMLDSKEFLTMHEARAFLGISRAYLYQLKDTRLPAYSLGKKTYFKKSDLESLFKLKPAKWQQDNNGTW